MPFISNLKKGIEKLGFKEKIHHLFNQEDLNFLLTNRLPRIWLTRFMGRFSKIEIPWVKDASIGIWKFFSDLDLSEAKKEHFTSMHDCFTRELKPGLRPINPSHRVLSSPVDAIVGAFGTIQGDQLFQAKGLNYRLEDLLGLEENLKDWHGGYFVTLRLTSSMYHRFHAPYKGRVEKIRYFSGDTWNVNPIALKRVEKLFCKNERAFIQYQLEDTSPLPPQKIAMVPVAAILVASIHFNFLNVMFHLKYTGPNNMTCDSRFEKGQEMGRFEQGSTIILLTPPGWSLDPRLQNGSRIKMGESLLAWTE